MNKQHLINLSPDVPILIAGPTASGKSALALEIAARHGGAIVNADALQVFANWRILTARPTPSDLAQAPHHLYGHVPGETLYSVGQWLREVAALMANDTRLIITGGTGLYFTALTEGLADIPETPPDIRARADEILACDGISILLADLDGETLARIDQRNPARVQRAWEVQASTGRGLAHWQDETPPPLLPFGQAQTILVNTDKDWLNARIAHRFDTMLAAGALDEARDNLLHYSPDLPSSKAIGAAQLIAHIRGEITLAQARESANTATRQYAKRQRSWFRARMRDWRSIQIP